MNHSELYDQSLPTYFFPFSKYVKKLGKDTYSILRVKNYENKKKISYE